MVTSKPCCNVCSARDTVLLAMSCPSFLRDAPEAVRGDVRVVMEVLRHLHNGDAFEHASLHLRSDADTVAAAVVIAPKAITHASGALRADRTYIMKLVTDTPAVLEHLPMHYRGNRTIVHTALRNAGEMLSFASLDLRDDLETVRLAMRNSAGNLEYATFRLRSYQSLVSEAVLQMPCILWCSPLRANPPFVRAQLRRLQNTSRQSALRTSKVLEMLRHVTTEVLIDDETILVALDVGGPRVLMRSPLRQDVRFIRMALDLTLTQPRNAYSQSILDVVPEDVRAELASTIP